MTAVNSEFRDARKASFQAAWNDLPQWTLKRSMTHAGASRALASMQTDLLSANAVFGGNAPGNRPSLVALTSVKEKKAGGVGARFQNFAICVLFVFLTTAGQVSLELTGTHRLYEGSDKQAFTSIFFLFSLVVGMIPQFVIYFGMQWSKSRAEGIGYCKLLRDDGLHTKDMFNVMLVATLFTINDYSRINAVMELGALNTVILSAPEVMIVAIMEIRFLGSTYNEIHFANFLAVSAITVTMALIEANSGESTLNATGLAWVSVHVVLKCLAGVYNAMFLKGKGGHWMLKVLSESIVMAGVMTFTTLSLVASSPTGLTIGSVLASMDGYAIAGAIFFGFRMVSVAFILKKLSPLSKVISQSFIGGTTALAVFLLEGVPIAESKISLLVALATVTFGLNRLTGKLQVAYRTAKDDMVDVMRGSFEGAVKKQGGRKSLEGKTASEAIADVISPPGSGRGSLHKQGTLSRMTAGMNRVGSQMFGGSPNSKESPQSQTGNGNSPQRNSRDMENDGLMTKRGSNQSQASLTAVVPLVPTAEAESEEDVFSPTSSLGALKKPRLSTDSASDRKKKNSIQARQGTGLELEEL